MVPNVIAGNAIEAIEYISDGEATDWQAAYLGLAASSPELGNNDIANDRFFSSSPTKVKQLMSDNWPWVEYSYKMLMPHMSVQIQNILEPYRIFRNETTLFLRLKISRRNKFQSVGGNECGQFRISSPDTVA